MRPVEPHIETRADPGGTRIVVRYETPEGRRLIRSLQTITGVILAVVLIAMAVQALAHWPAALTSGERMVAMLAAAGALYGLAREIAARVAAHRFWLRPLTDQTLTIDFHREAVQHGAVRYSRTEKIAFTSEPHRWARQEERAEQTSGQLLPETYRHAHEVRLQHGEAFVVLAEVSDEPGANAIARRLQAADDAALRGSKAFSKGAVFGQRQQPE